MLKAVLTSVASKPMLKSAARVLVPAEFGDHGIKGIILAANYARENKVPYLGIFLGMQISVIDFARSVLGLEKPNSSKFDARTLDHVVIFMPEGMYYQETSRTDQFTWEYCKNGLASTGGTLELSLFCLL
ncbi:hypothetical protein AgCh_030320 [Apium graveolens]